MNPCLKAVVAGLSIAGLCASAAGLSSLRFNGEAFWTLDRAWLAVQIVSAVGVGASLVWWEPRISRLFVSPAKLAWLVVLVGLLGWYCAIVVYFDRAYVDPTPKGRIVGKLVPPFEHYGYANIAPTIEVDKRRIALSLSEDDTVKIVEDGRELGPEQDSFTEVRDIGRGRFFHSSSQVIFSSSDGSDPASNGRMYWLVVPFDKRN